MQYCEKSDDDKEEPKIDHNKKETTNVNSPNIKKIKLKIQEKKSSSSLKSNPNEINSSENAPFSITDKNEKNNEGISEPRLNSNNKKEDQTDILDNSNGALSAKKEISGKKENSNLFSQPQPNSQSLFSGSNIQNNNNSLFPKIQTGSLFSGSLFTDNSNKNSLFPNTGSNLPSLFSNLNKPTESTGLFNFSNLSQGNSFFNNKTNESDDEGSDGEEDKNQEKRSDSPEAYKPNTEKTTGPYNKKYVKLVDNFFVYNKKEKKYLSKGDGYFSIEYSEEPKKSAVFVFR